MHSGSRPQNVWQRVLALLAGKQPLATGTPTGSKFLRDDNSWQTPPGGGGGVSDGDYGDITISGTGTAFTIDNDVVTYAKMQNVSATDKVLGRSTAGAGDVEEIACTAAGRALIDDATASDQRTTLGLGTLATQSGTFSGTSSGTNTGDQTISLTGDVTGSGTGSFAASISSSVLTTAARTVTDDTTVAAMVDTLGGASSTGTGGLARATSPTFVTPLLGTPTSGTLTNCTGLPISSGVSGLASGAATWLATPSSSNLAALCTDETGSGALVFATSPTLVTPILGTPTSGTLTNCTGLPISTGVSGLGANVATFLATPSSANLAAALTDETGSSKVVFNTSPSLITPDIGVATATSVNKVAITAPATSATLTIANGATLTVSASATVSNGTHSGTNTGDQTNITGNAATVTTNANLTGPITSVGNATTIADAELAAIAGLTSAANKLPRFTGSGTADLLDVNSTAAASTVPISSSVGYLDKAWIRPPFFDRRLAWVEHNTSGTQTVSRFGLVADPTSTGTTITDGEAASGSYEGCQSGNVSGNTAGRITTTGWYRDWSPRFVAKILTHTNISNCRYWFGLTSADLSGVTTPTTQSVAAFRYDTGTDGTAFWRCITCDGASNVTATTTTIAIATSTAYNLRIEVDEANSAIRFYVDNVLAATHTTNRPATVTAMLAQLAVTTLTANVKKFSWSWFGVDSI